MKNLIKREQSQTGLSFAERENFRPQVKKFMHWMLAAILICGTSVFTACNNSEDNPTPDSAKNRKEFIQHTRQNLKELAENLNFSSWTGINHLNNDFNTSVLNNPAFDKTVSTLFSKTIQQSIKPVEEGSELAQMGYQMYAVIDFTAFNYRFKENDEGTGFDVEPAEDFLLIFKRMPIPQGQDGMGPMGPDDGLRPEGDRPTDEYEALLMKASGSSVDMIASRLSTDQLAVIVRIPTAFDFSIGMLMEDGTIKARLTGTFKNEFASRGTSSFINLHTDAWNVTGTLQANLDVPQGGEGPQGGEAPQRPENPDVKPQADASTVTFAIGQDPATHEGGLKLGFIHNNRNILNMRGVMKNLNGQTDYSTFTSSTSIVEVFTAIMAGNSLEEGVFTMLDDLTTTLKVTDCAKVVELQRQMARDRRNYANEATIDGYVQQLNGLVSGSMTCKGLENLQIPMKLQTIKFGVDYWAMPALNFADEKGYVALTDMLDKESIEYMINIIDHAAEPVQQSIVTVRQLIQYMQTLIMQVREKQPQTVAD